MPLSLQIQALFAIEIIKEFRGYGLNLVAQERRTGAYNGAAAREFHSLYNLDEAAAIIWVSEPLFANIVNTERLAGRNMDLCPPTGWIYFPGAPNVQGHRNDRTNDGSALEGRTGSDVDRHDRSPSECRLQGGAACVLYMASSDCALDRDPLRVVDETPFDDRTTPSQPGSALAPAG